MIKNYYSYSIYKGYNSGHFLKKDEIWRRNNNFHREDGPALKLFNIDDSFNCYWYLNGRHHRKDGPAINYSDGAVIFYFDGLKVAELFYD